MNLIAIYLLVAIPLMLSGTKRKDHKRLGWHIVIHICKDVSDNEFPDQGQRANPLTSNYQ